MVAEMLPDKVAVALHWQLMTQLRLQSFQNWRVRRLNAPVTLFRSEEYWSTLPEFGWSELCDRVDVVPIGGSHFSMLEMARHGLETYASSLSQRHQRKPVIGRQPRRPARSGGKLCLATTVGRAPYRQRSRLGYDQCVELAAEPNVRKYTFYVGGTGDVRSSAGSY